MQVDNKPTQSIPFERLNFRAKDYLKFLSKGNRPAKVFAAEKESPEIVVQYKRPNGRPPRFVILCQFTHKAYVLKAPDSKSCHATRSTFSATSPASHSTEPSPRCNNEVSALWTTSSEQWPINAVLSNDLLFLYQPTWPMERRIDRLWLHQPTTTHIVNTVQPRQLTTDMTTLTTYRRLTRPGRGRGEVPNVLSPRDPDARLRTTRTKNGTIIIDCMWDVKHDYHK